MGNASHQGQTGFGTRRFGKGSGRDFGPRGVVAGLPVNQDAAKRRAARIEGEFCLKLVATGEGCGSPSGRRRVEIEEEREARAVVFQVQEPCGLTDEIVTPGGDAFTPPRPTCCSL